MKNVRVLLTISLIVGLFIIPTTSFGEPTSQENPYPDKGGGNLNTFSITLGAQENNRQGSFLNLFEKQSFSLNEAVQNLKQIDLFYAYNQQSGMNFLTPMSSRIKYFDAYNGKIGNAWFLPNNGYFINLQKNEKADEMFAKVKTRVQLVEAYNSGKKEVKEYAGYKTLKNGPARSIQEIKVGDIILFQSYSKDIYAVAKVVAYKAGVKGSVKLKFKVTPSFELL